MAGTESSLEKDAAGNLKVLVTMRGASRSKLLKLQCASESPMRFTKMQILGQEVWDLAQYSAFPTSLH